MNEPNNFVGDDLDFMGDALATLEIEDGCYVQPEPGVIQSFEYHDSDFLSPSYTGPLFGPADPLLPSNTNLAFLASLLNDDTAMPNLEDFDIALNEDPRPVMPLGDDEIELRSTHDTRSYARFESFNPMNASCAFDVVHNIGNVLLTHDQAESQVVETGDSTLEEQPTKSHQPKFKRHNQIVLEGNNKVGNKGKLRCIECRKVHSKCVRPEGSDACEYCQLRGRQCIMTWGAKKEKLLALSRKQTCGDISRQLPTADDTLVSEDERWRLQWVVCNQDRFFLLGELIMKIMAVYGVTISHPSLRLAVLALADFSSPYEKQAENFVLRSIAVGSQIPASDLNEADLIATSLLAFGTYWLRVERRRLQHKLPSCWIHLKRFCELMKKLAPEGKQSISRCAFGREWLFFMDLVYHSTPLYGDDPSGWELLLFASQIFDLRDFTTWTDAFGCWDATQFSALTAAWARVINHHFLVIGKSFSLLAEHGFDENLPENELQKTILRNSLLALSAIDSSPFHQQMVCAFNHAGSNTFSHNGMKTTRHIDFFQLRVCLRNFYAAGLLVTLILGADNISKSSKLDEAAFHASRLTFEVCQYYDPRVATDWSISAWNVMFVAVASIVYPVSQVTQVRNAIANVLSFAAPWIGGTVQKYWSDPEAHLGEMLGMVRSIWITTMQCTGNAE